MLQAKQLWLKVVLSELISCPLSPGHTVALAGPPQLGGIL